MSRAVLDSSAILAVLNKEKGWENAEQYFSNGIISSANAAEVLTKIVERGVSIDEAVEVFNLLQLDVIALDFKQAEKIAELRPLTKHLGLSLGDRCCLALAITESVVAVTADKEWTKLKICKIKVIR